MRIVAGRTKAACRIVFIKADIHSQGDVRFWHKADITTVLINVRYWG
jgi:hypothetical protein